MKKNSTPRLIPSHPPRALVPFTPFSFDMIAKELDALIREVYPTLEKIADAPEFTAERAKLFYGFLNEKAKSFISISPFPGYSRILTVIRTDGIVVVDKTIKYPDAVMIGGVSSGNSLSNLKITRQNTDKPVNYPTEIMGVNEFITLKAYQDANGKVDYYDVFEPFSTRTEFIQANTFVYGWTTRPGIYIQGQLYCVARAVGFYGKNTITFFFRVSYVRNVK